MSKTADERPVVLLRCPECGGTEAKPEGVPAVCLPCCVRGVWSRMRPVEEPAPAPSDTRPRGEHANVRRDYTDREERRREYAEAHGERPAGKPVLFVCACGQREHGLSTTRKRCDRCFAIMEPTPLSERRSEREER